MAFNPYQKLLFLLNATVLITHQIDAAFWHEWELFRIPGGNQINLLLNLPIIALVLYAQAQVATGSPTARAYYTLIAGLGFLTVLIHSAFFFRVLRNSCSQCQLPYCLRLRCYQHCNC